MTIDTTTAVTPSDTRPDNVRAKQTIRITEQYFGFRMHFVIFSRQLVHRVSRRALSEPQTKREASQDYNDEEEHPYHDQRCLGAALARVAGLDSPPRPARREAVCAVRTGVPRTRSQATDADETRADETESVSKEESVRVH